jgi:hypothetical protein
MIAIESLLTKHGDKYSAELPNRIEAFLGWIDFWQNSNYADKIRKVYKKRCQYVHDGNPSNINVGDLLFVDTLLLNVLVNIIKHHNIFRSKQNLVDFANKVSAERLLGIVGKQSKVRPSTLVYIAQRYNKDDFKGI